MEPAAVIDKLNADLSAQGLELGEPVAMQRDIDASAKQIWHIVSTAGYLTHCHPFCQTNDVANWPGVGARDTVLYYSGVCYQRDFVTWIEDVGYDLEIGPPPAKTARVSWRIEPLSESRSMLTIEVVPYIKSDLPQRRKQAYQQRAFGQTIASYLDSVLQGVAHFVTTGQAVRKNQFGSHPIYSP